MVILFFEMFYVMAVVIGGCGVLIEGVFGVGKFDFVLCLIDCGVLFVSDDYSFI